MSRSWFRVRTAMKAATTMPAWMRRRTTSMILLSFEKTVWTTSIATVKEYSELIMNAPV